MKLFVDFWKTLNQSIYTGNRLKANLRALTTISIFTSLLGVVLIALNIKMNQVGLFYASIATFAAGVGCAFCAGILKKREAAAMIPTVFCAIMFTLYSLKGLGEGTALLWSLLMPIGVCYFVSVRNGIILSMYYSVFYFILFYSPLRVSVAAYYSEMFMKRFPLIYASLAIFTAISMFQYHKGVLLENEYAERLSREVEKQTRVATDRANRLEAMSGEVVQALARAIDAKDKYTNGHSFRVMRYSVALAQALGWDAQAVAQLRREALMHDIGKIGVPDAVLNKPGKLNDDEYEAIKAHTTVGGKILSDLREMSDIASVAVHHHERYDGHGYPFGLAGTDIPAEARVVAIADAYDAMHSARIYRPALPDDVIRAELKRGRGTQFDPAYLDVFLELLDEGVLDLAEAG